MQLKYMRRWDMEASSDQERYKKRCKRKGGAVTRIKMKESQGKI